MNAPLVEHQINQLVFSDIERFMAAHEVPKSLSTQNLTPLPYIATVGDVDVAFLSLFRSAGPGRAAALVIQYSVRIGGAIVATMIRSSTNPVYGMMHFRKDKGPADLAHLQSVLKDKLAYRAMTKEEVDQFAIDAEGLEKKQIRIMVGEK